MEKPQILCKKMVEHKWKEEEWGTIERKKEKRKFAQQITNSIFLQNEVTNSLSN